VFDPAAQQQPLSRSSTVTFLRYPMNKQAERERESPALREFQSILTPRNSVAANDGFWDFGARALRTASIPVTVTQALYMTRSWTEQLAGPRNYSTAHYGWSSNGNYVGWSVGNGNNPRHVVGHTSLLGAIQP
jgi:hypothetical protein